jgi:hypothetical protein
MGGMRVEDQKRLVGGGLPIHKCGGIVAGGERGRGSLGRRAGRY